MYNSNQNGQLSVYLRPWATDTLWDLAGVHMRINFCLLMPPLFYLIFAEYNF